MAKNQAATERSVSGLNDLLSTTMSGTKAAALTGIANDVSSRMPGGYETRICIENGAAWVTLISPSGYGETLPDAADKTLFDQLNDAVHEANKWST